MKKNTSYPIPVNEQQRLKTLYEYDILDTLSEKEYNSITRVAAQICGVPVSLISFIDKDRQWFKSHHGTEMQETTRDVALCNYTIADPKNMLVVPDARLDKRFESNPLVTSGTVIFYAGVPLVAPGGTSMGSICVIDTKANNLNENQKEALQCLADQVMLRLEMRKKNKKLHTTQNKLKKANEALKHFAHTASHDMKTPLANISLVLKAYQSRYGAGMDEDAHELLSIADTSAKELLSFISNILVMAVKIKNTSTSPKTDCLAVINKVIALIAPPADISIKITGNLPKVCMDKTRLQQVFQNLITNAIKYNDKKSGIVNISSHSIDGFHYFVVTDNGCGIPKQHLSKIFKRGHTLSQTDRYGNKGTGSGLAMVKNIIENGGGKIKVESQENHGSVFRFSIPHSK